MLEAQNYIEINLNDKEIKFIDLSSLENQLTGELNIKDYSYLEEVNLSNNKLTSLTIDCPNLKKINVRNNQLTKLEIKSNNVEEIIGGDNKFSFLDLSNCNKIKKLIIPDNPYLTEMKGLNLINIREFNIANTPVKIGVGEGGDLKAENESLYTALNKIKEAVLKKKMVIAELIRTPRQAEIEIVNLLKEAVDKWKKHFYKEGEKDPFLEANLDSSEKKTKARKILVKIIGTLTSHNYEKLLEEWNEGQTYNVDYDFDGGSLARLIELLKIKNKLQESLKKNYEQR